MERAHPSDFFFFNIFVLVTMTTTMAMMKVTIFSHDDYDTHHDLMKTLSCISRIVCQSMINHTKTQYTDMRPFPSFSYSGVFPCRTTGFIFLFTPVSPKSSY